MLLIALLVGFFSSIVVPNSDATPGFFRWWIARLFASVIASFVWVYVELPALGNPMWDLGGFLFLISTANAAIVAIYYGATEGRQWGAPKTPKVRLAIAPLVFAVLYFGSHIMGSVWLASVSQSKVLARYGAVETLEWEKNMKSIDPDHMVMVSYEQASYRGGTTLNQGATGVASRFDVKSYAKQKVDGHLQFVAPLEWRDFWKFQSGEGAPGFVEVSAEDARAEPEFTREVKGRPLNFRYLPSAYWDYNLQRHLWTNGFSEFQLVDPTLELNDDGQPFFVVSLVVPTIGWNGREPVGVAIVDPETGNIERHTMKDIPAWVDRVIPDDIAWRNVETWGSMGGGARNYYFTERDVLKPTTQKMIWGDDGNCYWYHEIRSSSGTDRSRTGFMLVSTRTGKASFYRQHSGISMQAALDAVAGAVANNPGYHPAEAIQFPIYERLAYVMPVLTPAHVFELIAIVDSGDVNSEVALGKTKDEALANFRRILAKQNVGNSSVVGRTATLTEVEGMVVVVGEDLTRGNKVWYFTLDKVPGKIFTGAGDLGPDLVMVHENHRVKLAYVDTIDRQVPIQKIENLSISGTPVPVPVKK